MNDPTDKNSLPSKKAEADDVYKESPGLKRNMLVGLLVLLVFFGGFLLWSVLFPLESAAIAPGRLIVESQRKTVQHLEGGIVQSIYVRDGSIVEKGDMLLELDDLQALTSYNLYQSQADELLAAEARLVAERAEAKEITWHERTLQKKNDPEVRKNIEIHQQLFESNRNALEGQIKILKQQIKQLEKEIESLQAQVVSVREQSKLIEEEREALAFLEQRKLVDKPRLLAVMREAARLRGNLGEYLGLIAKAEQQINEARLKIFSLQYEARRDVLESLSDSRKRLAEVLEKEAFTKDILARTEIRAPQSGVVFGLQQHTLGGVIRGGDTILEIVPVKDELVVEAEVNPNDINVVHEGLKVHVTLLPYEQRVTRDLIGYVTHISADTFANEETEGRFYRALITIPPEEVKRVDGVRLYPGMPVQVMILAEKQSLFSYIFGPIRDSFNRAFREP